MVKMSDSKNGPEIECKVTFPEETVREETVGKETVGKDTVGKDDTIDPTATPDISIPMVGDCATMMAGTTTHSPSELTSRILENMKAIDEIQRKVKETRATFINQNKTTNPAMSSTTDFPAKLTFTNVISTVQERLATAHEKDFTQHANIIRGDLLTFLDIVPNNNFSDKLKNILRITD